MNGLTVCDVYFEGARNPPPVGAAGSPVHDLSTLVGSAQGRPTADPVPGLPTGNLGSVLTARRKLHDQYRMILRCAELAGAACCSRERVFTLSLSLCLSFSRLTISLFQFIPGPHSNQDQIRCEECSRMFLLFGGRALKAWIPWKRPGTANSVSFSAEIRN